MAVSIDRVYQKVLALANKEQRGYITPQEFNLFADHAQMEIFEQYFYDLEQFERDVSSDIDSLIEQKIQIFSRNIGEVTHSYSLESDVHKIDYIWLKDDNSDRRTLVERVYPSEILSIKSSSLLNNLSLIPVYYVYNNDIYFHPAVANQNLLASSSDGSYSYQLVVVKKPAKPNWTYVISGENALYNPNGLDHHDFELHSSEENELVVKILALAGVAIKDLQLAQVAAGKEASTTQQQKQ